jgi:hypothetical protein
MGARGMIRKPERKRPLGRLRCNWVESIKMNLGEIEFGDVDWIGLVQDRQGQVGTLVNVVMNLHVP